ncbi:LysR family transcriptional regulator [Aureimonas altamirensis]|uniref:LysR family transcriptional regulator n=1 Tax=Aureimonas altamirensis TaxID=370622 RepID=UPI002036B931|nr:LysR family transcriptional regulator [Aureimonas altamirensis]MCM2502470.1 LysR family transcriptional regulator [Aureimonas altamirensis]
MYTIKQLEAFCLSATLGSFSAASRRLFTTQSTVAKRVGELEGFVGMPLFERRSRSLKLTEEGRSLLGYAEQMIELHQRLLHSMTDASRIDGKIRIGATELVGMTWLPTLIQTAHERYPQVEIEPEIDGGIRLYERLDRNEIDIAVMPGPFSSPAIGSEFVGEVENAWMAGPSFAVGNGTLSAAEVSRLPVIVQPTNSALTFLYQNWFDANGFAMRQTLPCNSVGMVAQLTMNGLGLSYLPRLYYRHHIGDGRLRIVDVVPELPRVRYFAFYRRRDPSPVVRKFLSIIQEVQDFSLT